MEITGTTRVVGVIGWPLTYTLSPVMHNAALEKLGLNFVYVAFPVRPEHVVEAVRGLCACGVRGLNVTIPHKERVMELMDELSVEASAVGAVNTIRMDGDRMWGGNTDVYGFTQALRDVGFTLAGKRVAIAGAGGAARAIAAAALLEGATAVALWDVVPGRAEKIVADFQQAPLPHRLLAACNTDEDRRSALARCHLLVNASPVGMKPDDPAPVDVSLLPEGCMVFDSVYNVAETALMREARARSLQALGGLTMLVHQGARSFEIWFGVKPDTNLMLERIQEKLHGGK
ncbi:MAG: shikimate dehydrogenase [Candidatus Sumerlaeia bacterium]|nr:shikimate dehydrogenase [Candidatus Sumerlaeia bacterium]